MSSLFELLQRLEDLDDQDDIDLTEHLKAIDDVRQKVDRTKFVLDQLALQQSFWDGRIKRAQEKKRVIVNAMERIKTYVATAMLAGSSDVLEGHEFSAKIYEHEAIETTRDPNDLDMVRYHDYLKVRYQWDKVKIKNALRDGQNIGDFAKVAKTHSVRFKERTN